MFLYGSDLESQVEMAKPMGYEVERLVTGFTAAVNLSRVADHYVGTRRTKGRSFIEWSKR